MVSFPTTPTAATATVSPRLALLESLIASVLAHVSAEFTAMAERIALVLLDPEQAGGDDKLLYQRFKAGNLIRKDHYAFLHLYASTLERTMRQELVKLAPAPAGAGRGGVKAKSLSLVPYEEMDEQVAFGALSQPFDVRYAEELAVLNLRLASLMERDSVRGTQNPFRPEVFLVALQAAWSQFEHDPDAHGLFLPLCKPDLCFDFAPLYVTLCRALAKPGGRAGAAEAAPLRKADTHDATLKSAARAQAELTERLHSYFSSDEGRGVAAAAAEQAQQLRAAAARQAGAGGGRHDGGHGGGQDGGYGGGHGGGHNSRSDGGHNGGLDGGVQGGLQGGGQGGLQGGPGRSPAATVAAAGFAPAGTAAPMGAAAGWGGAPGSGAGAGATHAGQHGAAAGVAAPTGAMADSGAALAPQVEQAMRSLLREPLMAYLAQLQQAGALTGAAPGGQSGAVRAAAGFVAATGTPAPRYDPAMEALPIPQEEIYLPRIKASAPKGSLTRTDEHTIDLLAGVFDTVFTDTTIAREIRQMMGMLQIPVLKAALSDKEFFFEQAHPARRLIDLLARMGWEQRKGPEDPMFQAMQRSVERVGRDFDQEMSVFSDAVSELEASMQAQEQHTTLEIAAPIASALQQEKRAEAVRAAQQSIAARIDTGELQAMLENFLEKKWVNVLAVAYGIERDKPGAVRNATATMDELIWSVKPKLTKDERQRFIRKLPPLLAALNKWLDVIAWQDADRLQFFAELAECHASIVRAPLDLTPERQLEIAVEVAQQAAERRLQRQARTVPEPAPPPDAAVDTVDALERGMWLEFDQPDGASDRVKLAWISPLRSLFIFATSARQEACSMAAETLAKRLRLGTVRLLRADGLVGRALEQAMAQMVHGSAASRAAAAHPAAAPAPEFDVSLELPHLRQPSHSV